MLARGEEPTPTPTPTLTRRGGAYGGRRWRLFLAVVFAVLRLGIVSAVVEISALDHVVEELAAMDGDGGAHGCDERSCPPGCPTCHHHHAVLLPASVPPPPVSLEPVASADVAPVDAVIAPRSRSVAPLERPPRLVA